MKDNKLLLNEIFGSYNKWLCLSGIDSIAKKVITELRKGSERDLVVTFSGSRLESELAEENLLTVPYNDIAEMEKALAENGERILAVAVEPVLCRRGLILPKPNFLNRLRRLTKKHNILLLFDETDTTFHVKQGSVQKLYGILPDVTVCNFKDKGQVAFVGFNAEDLIVAETGDESKTACLESELNLAESLALVEKQESYIAIILGSIQKAAARYNLPLQSQRLGDMFSLYFSEIAVSDYQSIENSDFNMYRKFNELLEAQGASFSKSVFRVNYLDENSDAEYVEALIEKIDNALSELASFKA